MLMTNNKNHKLSEIAATVEAIYKRAAYELPRKSIRLALRERCLEDVDAGLEDYHQLKAQSPELYDVNRSDGLNMLATTCCARSNPRRP